MVCITKSWNAISLKQHVPIIQDLIFFVYVGFYSCIELKAFLRLKKNWVTDIFYLKFLLISDV